MEIKKIKLYLLIAIILIAIVGAIVLLRERGQLGGAPDSIWVKKDLVGTSASPYDFAKDVSKAYLIATSTSIMPGDYGFSTLSLKIKLINASSTANTLSITPLYSDDDNCSGGGTNWYKALDANLTNNQGATSTPFAAATTTFATLNITGITSQCVKIITSTTHASSTAWIEGLFR